MFFLRRLICSVAPKALLFADLHRMVAKLTLVELDHKCHCQCLASSSTLRSYALLASLASDILKKAGWRSVSAKESSWESNASINFFLGIFRRCVPLWKKQYPSSVKHRTPSLIVALMCWQPWILEVGIDKRCPGYLIRTLALFFQQPYHMFHLEQES